MTKEENKQTGRDATLKAKNRMTLLALVVLIAVLFVVTIIKVKTQSI